MKKRYIIVGSALVLLTLFVVSFLFMNRAVTSESEIKSIYVSETDTFTSISIELEEAGIIRSASFMQFVLRFKLDKSLYVGVFDLDPSWSTLQIIDHLNNPDNLLPNVVQIQLPSWRWAKDYATILAADTNLEYDDIINTWNDPEYILSLTDTYPFLSGILEQNDLILLLEGYLYPDTYEFNRITTVDEVTRKILNKTASVLEPLADDIAASGFSTHEVLTLASIVNYEGSDETSMRMIADVFLNRLAINMTLGSSVTVCYALYTYETWQECEANTSIDSPFNTYIHVGLPPGPVMNPTETAILAVLDPIETDYYYFVADITTGEIYFARTYTEHQQNVARYVDPYR